MNNTPTAVTPDTPRYARQVVMSDEGPYFNTPDGYQMQKLWNRYPTPAAVAASKAYAQPHLTAFRRALSTWFHTLAFRLGWVRIAASSPVLTSKPCWHRYGPL